jgi:hypothetical protein
MTPRDVTTPGERNVELAAGDALTLRICEKTLVNLATLLIGCLRSRDGLNVALGGNVRAAGTDLLRRGLLWNELLRRGLLRKSLALSRLL